MTSLSETGAPRAERPQPSDADRGSKLEPGLYVVATPIGNLGDLSPRARTVLATADLVLCEDTRITGRLLHLHGIERPLLPYHEHNAARVRPQILARLMKGEAIALTSDAGTPLVSDPGYKLVRDALDAGIPVHAVPGPSAAIAALTVSGLPSDRFFVTGFLPRAAAERRRMLHELAGIRATLVLFESPRRLAATLRDLAAALGEREVAVARELTKRFEEVRRGSLAELAAYYAQAGPPRGEVVVVVGPPSAAAMSDESVDDALREALATMPPAAAAAGVAAASGRPRREVYRRALALKRR